MWIIKPKLPTSTKYIPASWYFSGAFSSDPMHGCRHNPRHGWCVDRWHWWCSVYIVLVIRSCMTLVMACVLLVLICSRPILVSVVLWSDQPVISHARIKGWCDNQELKCIICQTNSACYIWMILSRLNYFLSRIFQCFCRMSVMRWFKHKSHGRLLMFCT